LIGKSLGTYLTKRGLQNVVVGRDDRASSIFLCESFIQGLLSTGCNVTHVGITTTPAIQYFTCGTDFDAGVTVTASHNPPEFNGLVIDLQGADQLYGSELMKLATIIDKGVFSEGDGKYVEKELNANYVEFMRAKLKSRKDLKVVINCGFGAPSELTKQIFGNQPLDFVPLGCSFDSNFPQGIPNPENESYLRYLQTKVVETKSDAGFCFDTDGNRIGMVDEKGTAYSASQLLMLLAKAILTKKYHRKIVFDVKSSDGVSELVRSLGGSPKMIRTGHPHFIQAMKEDTVALGGEYSGHIYISDDFFGYDDAIYVAIRLINILADTKVPLSKLMAALPQRVGSPEIKVACDDKKKFQKILEIEKAVYKEFPGADIVKLDGVRVHLTKTGWFLIRVSNTTPNLSIRLEGKDVKEEKLMATAVTTLLKKVGLHATISI
jgi:phosphomannomutase/phosphoglucomutase